MTHPALIAFREKFTYASFTWKGDNETGVKFAKQTLKQVEELFLTSLDSEYARGLKDGEGTKNGMERYTLGYKDGERSVESAIEKISDLSVVFPVRESDDFDEGRLSMRNEVLEMLANIKK